MPMYWMMNNITRQIAEFLFRNLFFATKRSFLYKVAEISDKSEKKTFSWKAFSCRIYGRDFPAILNKTKREIE